jgi:class 3 adenylate cyclase
MNRSPLRYARTSDGVNVAYWTFGKGPVLVECPLIPFSHIEAEWRNPHVRRWYERMGEMVTLLRYDSRGTGLSQRKVEDVSIEGHVRDLEAVVSQVGDETVALLGVFHSGPAAILYAARHPDRVSHLLLWCAYARGSDYWTANQSEGLRALRQTDYRLFLRTAAHELIGWADDGESDAFADVMRDAVEPETADALLTATRDWDVSSALSDVLAPTLVVHRHDLDWISVDLSRDLASAVPGAQLTQIEGNSPLPAAGPIEAAVQTVTSFLGLDASPIADPGQDKVRVILFTDLVGHTQMMDELGDDLGRQILREHERLTRRAIAEFNGTEVKALGDGFMASFGSVSAAIEAAITIQKSIAAHNSASPAERHPLTVRAGINAGEPIEEDGDLFGAAVILASRIADQAAGGQILVSTAIRELGAGKKFVFARRPDFVPKGFDESVQTWEVEWTPAD